SAALEVQHRLTFEHVEARLERVHVLVDVAVGQRDQRQCHVRRAERAADHAAGGQAAGASRQPRRQLDVLAPDEPIAGQPFGQLPCASVAHRGTPARSTTAEDATASATPGSPSRPFSETRSAPRTYVLPATSSSSAGKRVMISQPAAVTTTSSSMRAAERPSVAAQYVSSANTIPSSRSTRWSSEGPREVIGGSYSPTPPPWPNWRPRHVPSSGN